MDRISRKAVKWWKRSIWNFHLEVRKIWILAISYEATWYKGWKESHSPDCRTTVARSGVVWNRGRQLRGCQGGRQYHLACVWTRHWVRLLTEIISFGSHNKPRKHIWLLQFTKIWAERLRNLPKGSKIINARAKTWSEYFWSLLSALLSYFLTYTEPDVHLGK